MLETLIVLIIVSMAIFFMARRLIHASSGKYDGSECGSYCYQCHNCEEKLSQNNRD